jgi:hypothetical protein
MARQRNDSNERSNIGSMDMTPACISALSALPGSAIGALASFVITWLTQHHQVHTQRLHQEASRREQLFGEYIEQA